MEKNRATFLEHLNKSGAVLGWRHPAIWAWLSRSNARASHFSYTLVIKKHLCNVRVSQAPFHLLHTHECFTARRPCEAGAITVCILRWGNQGPEWCPGDPASLWPSPALNHRPVLLLKLPQFQSRAPFLSTERHWRPSAFSWNRRDSLLSGAPWTCLLICSFCSVLSPEEQMPDHVSRSSLPTLMCVRLDFSDTLKS